MIAESEDIGKVLRGYLITVRQYLASPKGYFDTIDFLKAIILFLVSVFGALALVVLLVS